MFPMTKHHNTLHRLARYALGATVALTPFWAQAAKSLDGLLYIPVDIENSVYVINPAQQKVLQKIPVGAHPIVLRALPDRSKIYVDNFGPLSSYLSVIDPQTNTVTKNITTTGAPYASMQLSQDGSHLYVPTTASLVNVIDTKTDKIIRTIKTNLLPIGVEVSPDDKTLYVFDSLNTVTAYSTATGARVKPSLSVNGSLPAWSTMTSDGKKLYALNIFSNNVTAIDTASWKVTKSIPLRLGALPLSGTISPDGKKLWVCNIGTYDITVIDTQTDTVSKIIPTKNLPTYVGFSPNGQTAYVSDLGPMSALPPFLRPLLYDIFYFLPPGILGHVTPYSVATGMPSGAPTGTGTGPVAGLYF